MTGDKLSWDREDVFASPLNIFVVAVISGLTVTSVYLWASGDTFSLFLGFIGKPLLANMIYALNFLHTTKCHNMLNSPFHLLLKYLPAVYSRRKGAILIVPLNIFT